MFPVNVMQQIRPWGRLAPRISGPVFLNFLFLYLSIILASLNCILAYTAVVHHAEPEESLGS